MSTLKLYFGLVLMTFVSIHVSKAQIFDNSSHEEDVETAEERSIFNSDPVFENRKTVTRRGSGGFDGNMSFGGNTANVPIDGGIGVMITGLVGYGIKRIKKSRKRSQDV